MKSLKIYLTGIFLSFQLIVSTPITATELEHVQDFFVLAQIDGNEFSTVEEFNYHLAENMDFMSVCNLNALLGCLQNTKYQGISWKNHSVSQSKLGSNYDKILDVFTKYIEEYNNNFILILE